MFLNNILSFIGCPNTPLNLIWIGMSTVLTISYLFKYIFPFEDTLGKITDFLIDYGKSKATAHPLDVPKRFFVHFYIWATLWNLYFLYILSTGGYDVNNSIHQIPALMTSYDGENDSTAGDSSWIFVTLLLLTLHTMRRLYENVFVSVFSNKARMTFMQYLWGLVYYTLLPPTLLTEAKFNNTFNSGIPLPRLVQVFGFLLYIIGNILEYKTLAAFARLRIKGRVKKESHGIAYGIFFDFVTCPHYLGEVCIYAGLLLVVGHHCASWRAVIIYNVVAHVLMAKSAHEWYKRTFPLYPTDRKAIFPYLL